jgi:hypothetical protein
MPARRHASRTTDLTPAASIGLVGACSERNTRRLSWRGRSVKYATSVSPDIAGQRQTGALVALSVDLDLPGPPVQIVELE